METELKNFLPSTEKISFVTSHPVQPWIAVVDRASGAQIWNWKTGEILYTAQFGGIDESAMHYHSLQKMAEVDQAYWGAKVSQEQSVSRTPSGRLKSIAFLDAETLYWNRVAQLSIFKGRSGEILLGDIPGAQPVQRERWAVFLCENKVLFHELLSHKSCELSKIALDSKNPTCLAILARDPSDTFLAIGCNDGTIRLISFATFKTTVKLGYTKSAAITCISALYLSPDSVMLMSGTTEGVVCIWNPFPKVESGGMQLKASGMEKAHDGEVMAISVGYSSPLVAAPGVFTLGSDRSIAVFEVPSLKVLSKFKAPSQKLNYHSMEICQPMEVTANKCVVLLAAQGIVQATTVSGGQAVTVFEPTAAFPGSSKKAPKIYHLSLHPLQRQYAVLGLRTGVALLKLPARHLGSTAALSVPRTPKKSLELTCVRVRGKSLIQSEFMLVQQEGGLEGTGQSVPETIMDREIFELSEIFSHGGDYSCFISPDSSKIVVSRTDQSRFIVLSNAGEVVCRAFEGLGRFVVWNASSDAIATLYRPAATQSTVSQRSLLRLLSKTEGSPETPRPESLKVYRLSSQTPEDIDLGAEVPAMIHGGPMLGVTTGSKTFDFYSWKTLQKCSNGLMAPEWIAWSTKFDLCAFAYSTHIQLLEVESRFRPLVSLPVEDSVSGLWKGDLLYVSTSSSVEVIVVHRSKDLSNPRAILSVQVMVLASFKNGPNWITGSVDDWTASRAQKPRPIGHLKALSASQGQIWLVDTHEQPAIIEIEYPGTLAFELIVDEQYSTARSTAIGKSLPDSIGEMLITMGKRSSIEALKIQGLSLPLRLKTAIEAGYFKHALLCLKAIVGGARHPEAVVRLPEFIETLKEDVATPTKSPTTADPFKSPFSTTEGQSTVPISLTAAITDDGIDWDAASMLLTTKPTRKNQVHVTREVLQLALDLHDAAVEERLYTVADEAANIVIDHAEGESGDLLISLETKLSSRGQTQQLKNLVALSEKSKKSTYCNIRSLTAAVLSGDLQTVSGALKELKLV